MELNLLGEIEIDKVRELIDRVQTSEEPIVLNINSVGGDVFAAIALSHALRNYRGSVEIRVVGLCASAAVLVLCCSRKVIAAFNSLFMIHSPSVMLSDLYNKDDLAKMQKSLEKVEETIQKTLSTRLKQEVDLRTETWLNAQEALNLGLIDEIDSAQVEMHVDNKQKLMFVNGVFFQIKNAMPTVKSEVDVTGIKEQIRAQELKRIADLQKMRGQNHAVNALIDVALVKGQSASEVSAYVEAVKNLTIAPDNFCGLLEDQKESGADGVQGGNVSAEDIKKAQMARMINFANGVT